MNSLIEYRIQTLNFSQIVDLFSLSREGETEGFSVFTNGDRNFILYSDSELKDIRCIDVSISGWVDKSTFFLLLSQSISQSYFETKFAGLKEIGEFSFPVSQTFNQVMKIYFNLASLQKIPALSVIPPILRSLSEKDIFRSKVYYYPAHDCLSVPLFAGDKISDFVDFNRSFFRSRYGFNGGLCEFSPPPVNYTGERCLIIPSNPMVLISYFFSQGFAEGQTGIIISPSAEENSLNDLFSYYVKNKYREILLVYDSSEDFLPENLFFMLVVICHFITLQTRYVLSVSDCKGKVMVTFLRFAESLRIDKAANLCSMMNETIKEKLSDYPVDLNRQGSDFAFHVKFISNTFPMISFPKKAEFLDVFITQLMDYFMLKNFSLHGIDLSQQFHSAGVNTEENKQEDGEGPQG